MHVIKKIGRPLRGPPILLITRMTTDRIGFHSVLLPLFMTLKRCFRLFVAKFTLLLGLSH